MAAHDIHDHNDDADSIVSIWSAANQLEAEMLQQVLADEGIVAMIKPVGAGHSFASPALVEHAVLVRGDQARLAREVAAAFAAEEDDPLESADTGGPGGFGPERD